MKSPKRFGFHIFVVQSKVLFRNFLLPAIVILAMMIMFQVFKKVWFPCFLLCNPKCYLETFFLPALPFETNLKMIQVFMFSHLSLTNQSTVNQKGYSMPVFLCNFNVCLVKKSNPKMCYVCLVCPASNPSCESCFLICKSAFVSR